MVQNSLVEKKVTFSNFMASEMARKKINEVIGGKDGQRFITSIVSAVSTNSNLQNCDHNSILASAMIGEALKLSPSPQMGHYYLVPYSGKAQFQMGYKGYIQLALRSGHYKDIDALPIKQGEYKGLDKNTGKPVFEFVADQDMREALPVIGYLAYFELTNGFMKKVYWTKTQMESHAKKFSKSYSSFWGKGDDGFNGMAIKTVLKQLLSRWGLLSIEMQSAIESDNEAIDYNAVQPTNITPEPKDDPIINAHTVETVNLDNLKEDDQGRLIGKDGRPI